MNFGMQEKTIFPYRDTEESFKKTAGEPKGTPAVLYGESVCLPIGVLLVADQCKTARSILRNL